MDGAAAGVRSAWRAREPHGGIHGDADGGGNRVTATCGRRSGGQASGGEKKTVRPARQRPDTLCRVLRHSTGGDGWHYDDGGCCYFCGGGGGGGGGRPRARVVDKALSGCGGEEATNAIVVDASCGDVRHTAVTVMTDDSAYGAR
ncbi:hypothetical protein ACI65C_002459 [Semiaphis heraclei]